MSLTLAISVGIGIIAGGLAHEVIHILTARLVGAEVAVDWWRLETAFRFEREYRLRAALVNASPYLVGVVLSVAWYLVLWPQGLTPFTAGSLMFILLLFYGGPEDFTLRPHRRLGGTNDGR